MHRAPFYTKPAAVVASLLLPVVLTFAGGAHAQESQLDAARAAAKSAPFDAEAALANGRALRRAGHDAEAQKELRRAVYLATGRSGDLNVRTRWESARAAIARRDFPSAMALCRQMTTISGGAAAGHACAAEAHLLYRRASEALVETTQAIALTQASPMYEAKISEGLARELELDDAAAEASLREALASKPAAPEAHLYLGRLLVRTGHRDEGIAQLRRASALDADSPEASYELGRVLVPAPEGLALLQRAVVERPTYVVAYLQIAELELAAGNLDAAQKAAEAAIKGDPKDHAAHTALGRVALAKGDADAALKEGEAALTILANSAAARLLMADAYASKREIDLAVESYQAAYGLDHGDPRSLVRASQACLAEGRLTSAKAFGEKATHEFPKLGRGYEAFGDALAADKEPLAAKAAYERAIANDGGAKSSDGARVKAKLDALTPRK